MSGVWGEKLPERLFWALQGDGEPFRKRPRGVDGPAGHPGRHGEPDYGALAMDGLTRFRLAVAILAQEAGACGSPQVTTGFAHPGDGDPEAYAAGGDAGAGDEFLDGQADGMVVGLLRGQVGVVGEDGADPLASYDDVEGVARAMGYEAYMGAGAACAVFGGVGDQSGEDLHRFGADVGGAQALVVEGLPQRVGQLLGLLEGAEDGEAQGGHRTSLLVMACCSWRSIGGRYHSGGGMRSSGGCQYTSPDSTASVASLSFLTLAMAGCAGLPVNDTSIAI